MVSHSNQPSIRRGAVYARKSTATEGKSKSLEEQVMECQLVCQQFNIELLDEHIYIEDEGKKGDWGWSSELGHPPPYRPELAAMVKDMEDRKFDVIVVWRTDRLYRDSGIADSLLKRMRASNVGLIASRHDYAIHTATGFANAASEAVRNREFRDKQSEDIKRDLLFKARAGQIVRPTNFLGFRSAGKTTRKAIYVPDELALVNRIFRMFVFGEDERGPLTCTSIATTLLDEGVRLPRLRKHRKGTHKDTIAYKDIKAILQNVCYIGRARHSGFEYDCATLLVPALDGSGRMETAVPVDLWEMAQQKIARSNKTDNRKEGQGAPTGTMACGYCGAALNIHIKEIDNGTGRRRYYHYHCLYRIRSRICKPGVVPYIRQEVIDNWVLTELAPMLIAEQTSLRQSCSRNADIERLADLKRDMDSARKRETDQLLQLMGVLDSSQFGELAKRLRGEREFLERQVKTLEERIRVMDRDIPSICLEDLGARPRAEIRAMLQAAINWIAVTNQGVIVLTRWGSYIAATIHKVGKPDQWSGNPTRTWSIDPPRPADAVTCLNWFQDPQKFIEGRRRRIGPRALRLSDDEILPGIDAFLNTENATTVYLPEFTLIADPASAPAQLAT